MSGGAVAAVPEQGQIVEVRHRRFVVADVAKSTLPQSLLAPSLLAVQHLVTLASVEDDALGEELQVIWELEPGARVYDQRALPPPTGFDAPQRLDGFLNAVRWGAASSADVRALQAPFHVNPWGHFPRLITSIDYLKRDQPMRLFRETLPAASELAYALLRPTHRRRGP